ncbi:MAG: isoprenylcysteine carboxylmethyltransferase family protein [Alicyclobacillaceae bacterium]|nr:isoprenylcysteine carboxylmethyltransferase family protein [Alicyclobacillaceae bacterium]
MTVIRAAIQGTAVLVLCGSIRRMLAVPLYWPFAAVLGLEAFWLLVSLCRAPRWMDVRPDGVLAAAGIAVYPALIAWLAPGPWVEPVWRFGVSYAVQIAALALQVWAFLTLRSALTQLPEAHRLVRTGPYRYVRHPLYTAYSLAFIGACIGAMRVSMWLLFAGFVLLQRVRAGAEERVLLAAFPEYEAYAAATGRFWPKWRNVA